MCHEKDLACFPGPCANLKSVPTSGIMGQFVGMMATSERETFRHPLATFHNGRPFTLSCYLRFHGNRTFC
jgi:hypothetical protein